MKWWNNYSFSLDVGSDQTVTGAGAFFSGFMNEQAVGSCQLTAGTFRAELTLDEGPLSGVAWAHGGATCHCGDQHQSQAELKQKLVHLFCLAVSFRMYKRKPIPNIGQSISSSQLLLQAVWGGLESSPHKTCPIHPFLTFSCPWQRPDIDLLEIMKQQQQTCCFVLNENHSITLVAVAVQLERKGAVAKGSVSI
ncbi:hypothetical protein T11_8103 [Trichinella zimbabwensis]|uniref:Uncharacterized protein n=1 Tax=Trichinella zimbabwensis TaxID=268475 RepID=A0A0V1HS37_9BILA|nr:hypothetical protein T11_8103 [Trichinella zimbabwensis]